LTRTGTVTYTAGAQRGYRVSSSILLTDEAGLARRNVRHNAVALGADFALFLVGLAFASQSTILPAFAAHLGAPNVVIGAIPAVMTLGWFLPSLFAAGHTESLARKLPFVMRFTLWERVPFLALALLVSIQTAGIRDNEVLLLMLTLLSAVFSGINGFGRRTPQAVPLSTAKTSDTRLQLSARSSNNA